MRVHSGPLLPCILLGCAFFGLSAVAQKVTPAVASVSTEGVTVKGAMSVADGRATLANNGEIAAGERAAMLELVRGGTVEVCASTTLHLARDVTARTAGHPDDAGLMFSLERGAFEAHYAPGAYADVVLTPEMRLLVSAPGQADLKLRVNAQGDTCVDNAGENAPYVVASSLMDGGAYRVRPGQRVMFVHGSLNEVVDNEREPCGCPGAPSAEVASGAGGPSSATADTAFPLAVSEGLQPPPVLDGTAPVVPNGVAHAQVSATLSSSGSLGPPPSVAAPAPAQTSVAPPAVAAPAPRRGFLGKVGHFFSKLFGAE